jgi:hypothetical protein
VLPVPVGMAESTDRPSADETAVLEPLAGEPDGPEAEQVERAESTLATEPPVRPSDDGGVANRRDAGEPVDERAPTQVSSRAR